MSKGIIRKGDKLTSGGEVISASSTIKVEGIVASRIGDLVSCPKQRHGSNPIVGSTSQWLSESGELAFDQRYCECSCQVISSSLILYLQTKDR
ncbi:PAAR domain-containing protein [Pantoea sp. GD03673]|uniref:PAAR domain-containing protein n=1 Tax=Pantoea sp. GD03673 TaxID=2975364 RepID=UPI002447EBA8|nr:PAAR domain-containing protein [Pantoea sp. GD03673]MDH2067449.1 PAAR domain-containing protein [Pantoea sp. GD03673]